jgi:hypothetical protein
MYKAIEQFKDLKDDRFLYKVGDKFPRKGKRVSKARLAELLGSDNRRGRPVIAEVEEEEE